MGCLIYLVGTPGKMHIVQDHQDREEGDEERMLVLLFDLEAIVCCPELFPVACPHSVTGRLGSRGAERSSVSTNKPRPHGGWGQIYL